MRIFLKKVVTLYLIGSVSLQFLIAQKIPKVQNKNSPAKQAVLDLPKEGLKNGLCLWIMPGFFIIENQNLLIATPIAAVLMPTKIHKTKEELGYTEKQYRAYKIFYKTFYKTSSIILFLANSFISALKAASVSHGPK